MDLEKLKQIAKDIHKRSIFTDRHIREGDKANMMTLIFMPLALIDEKGMKELIDSKPGMFYEYWYKAGPRSINGYPMFMSFLTLTQKETDKVLEYVRRLERAEDRALDPEQMDLPLED